MKSISRYSVLLAVVFVLAGPALYFFSWKLKPLLRQKLHTRLKLIDDFNDGTDTNLIGGEPTRQYPPDGMLTASLLRMTTPAPGDMACVINYRMKAGQEGSWGTGLNDLDISAAKYMQFYLKTDTLPFPELRAQLSDSFGHSASVRISSLRSSTSWQRIVIPTKAFSGVDLNQLKLFSIITKVLPTQASEGKFYLEDIAFSGPTNLFFRSLKDNLYGFPHRIVVSPHRLLSMTNDDMLRAIARDSWGYFRDAVDSRHHLPLNYIQTRPTALIGDYASTTDAALYMMSVVSAHDFNFIDYESALKRVRSTIEQLKKLPRWRGFFYNYYSTTNLQITSQYISSVDNGWLAVALVVARRAFPEVDKLATDLLNEMDFSVFYDPHNGQIRLGYDIREGKFAPYHYGLLSTEARVISIVAIGKGDLPESHWFRIYRTLPKEWTWQRQLPRGSFRNYRGHEVFNGYYTYDFANQKIHFVPSWGGSLFEFLMPTLVVDEKRISPYSLGLNDKRAVDMHIRYALEERRFPVWGLSPCATPKERHGGYSEFGVPALGSKGYKDEAIVTPHVSMLALLFAPEAAKENLRNFLSRYQIYGPYGLYDSVDVISGDVAYRYLAIDQGMTLVALDNYLNNGAIQRRFESDQIMKRVEPLLKIERFFDEKNM